MTTAAANKIQKDLMEGAHIERLTASGTTIKPGHCLILNSANAFTVQATAGADAPLLLAIESKFAGDSTDGGGTDKVYAAGTTAFAEFCLPGSLRYVRVPASQTLVIGDAMVYNNAGQLIKTTGSPLKVVATCVEAITTAAEELVLVRVA
jgi:hypothetical protein